MLDTLWCPPSSQLLRIANLADNRLIAIHTDENSRGRSGFVLSTISYTCTSQKQGAGWVFTKYA